MSDSHQVRAEEEIERLRRALEAETVRCLEIQRQLDRASGEFEDFVSKAVHDLREPLRDVAAFSELMAEAYAGRLDSDADVFLKRMGEGAARMQSLLTDVVEYWTTNRSGGQPARTDMEAVLRHALLLTDSQITERSAVVTHDQLPEVFGEFEMLAKVLQHLIRNAIEYGGTRVHISCSRGDVDWIISVQDNGPGIEPAFQDRVFGAFKRLHGKEYPGNGLGLAFCKKAVESRGGRMWLESEPGSGATFYFTVADS
jgi:light-regulated signal transduction histidine kinase (bacteriophytochrome)